MTPSELQALYAILAMIAGCAFFAWCFVSLFGDEL